MLSKDNHFIPYGKQWINDDDIKAVVDVLKSDWLTQGTKIKEFEERLTEYCGSKYAVAVSSGTAALHLACLAAGIKEGDEVITSPITFAASANCALYVGAKPVFVDIDKDTICLDPQKLEDYMMSKPITHYSSPITKKRALILVHFAGLACDIEKINKIAKENNLVVIEDACHALGAEYDTGEKVGSCEYSDMTVFSFHPVKHITTGEGGAVLTNDLEYCEKLLLLRNHGITKDTEKFSYKNFSSNSEPWYYEMQELGFNYRITDIQCALGLSQLKKLDSYIERRRKIAYMYNEAFKDIEYIKLPKETKTKTSTYHLYVLQIDFKRIKKSRAAVINELREKGIGIQVHYIPVYFQPYYQKLGYKRGLCPEAEDFYQREISIPIYPAMKDKDIIYVIEQIIETLRYAQ